MAKETNWAFPAEMRPKPEDWRFDLDGALDAVVQLRAEIPEDAFTAQILGTERLGNGVVIRDDGLVLTIGYLITEASTIWLTTNKGVVVPGFPLAYDQVTGFGLVQPLGKLGVRPLPRGSAASCRIGENVVVAGHGGRAHALRATVFAKREFAGYWEYLLDEAIYTAPAHPQWGGSALIGSDGKLLAVGSLLVQEKVDAGTLQGNMLVPIDLLAPILDDMLKLGRPAQAPRGWLGMYTTEAGGKLVVAGLAPDAPAERGGVKVGDVIVEVAGEKTGSLADLWRSVWALGGPGSEVPMKLLRKSAVVDTVLRSADRQDFLKKPHLH
ncbi:MAG TPA: S1C family serine protease [Burkholderiales bacterium]